MRAGLYLQPGRILRPAARRNLFSHSPMKNDLGMHTREIPSSGEPLPVIGCGTWKAFDVGKDAVSRAPLAQVLQTLFENGTAALSGRHSVASHLIDTSPMYGRAEAVVGDLLEAGKWHEKAFVATKVWTQGRDAGIAQMRRSMQLMQRNPIDLMQIHNLLDWRTHLETLLAWKKEGLIRYLGITHYASSSFRELEAVMRAEPIDFVQLNYSLEEREAEERLLPLAADREIAVIVNLPFGAGSLLRKVRGKQIPVWVKEIGCESWAEVLLKFVLSHTAVTCVIPGTGSPEHMAENCRGGMGATFDDALRERLIEFWDSGIA
jgi:diketogulonate reductase-like aldo/keto reductase